MEDKQSNNTRALADRVIALAEELEVSGEISLQEAELKRDREALHAWIDSAVGVVLTPGFARVSLIHENGKQSTISSWELCLALSALRNRKQT
jgi:repressor of nif and glnA expression